MRVLIGCEFSGVVRRAFRARGHIAISCDLLPADDGEYMYHLQEDVFDAIARGGWDLGIFHWPCTYLCNSGVKHLYKGGRKVNGVDTHRWAQMEVSAGKFDDLLRQTPIDRYALENPIMHCHAAERINRPPSQIIQPWMFGHREMKATCLWLHNLPLLTPTANVGPPPKDREARKSWARVHRESPGPDRWKRRSVTYTGIADAMAEQWGC